MRALLIARHYFMTERVIAQTYFLKYVQAASASSTSVMIHRDELLIPVFLAMSGIVAPRPLPWKPPQTRVLDLLTGQDSSAPHPSP